MTVTDKENMGLGAMISTGYCICISVDIYLKSF